ncbi:MAG: thioredoxin family protein [Candidatus Micrarchaeia archaeon]
MKIEILGMGCPKCRKLEENAKKAVAELGKSAEFVKVSDPSRIAEYGVFSTPALVINGEVKSQGGIPDVEQIKRWLER